MHDALFTYHAWLIAVWTKSVLDRHKWAEQEQQDLEIVSGIYNDCYDRARPIVVVERRKHSVCDPGYTDILSGKYIT
eukprot:2211741-Karenia_brevis.AAC.1